MTDLEKLTRRGEQLEARVEIAELTSAYAVACDEHDMERLGSLFAEDAVMDVDVERGRAWALVSAGRPSAGRDVLVLAARRARSPTPRPWRPRSAIC